MPVVTDRATGRKEVLQALRGDDQTVLLRPLGQYWDPVLPNVTKSGVSHRGVSMVRLSPDAEEYKMVEVRAQVTLIIPHGQPGRQQP